MDSVIALIKDELGNKRLVTRMRDYSFKYMTYDDHEGMFEYSFRQKNARFNSWKNKLKKVLFPILEYL